MNREVVIEGAVAMPQGIHPSLVDGHLRSLLMAWHGISKAPETPRARLVKS